MNKKNCIIIINKNNYNTLWKMHNKISEIEYIQSSYPIQGNKKIQNFYYNLERS